MKKIVFIFFAVITFMCLLNTHRYIFVYNTYTYELDSAYLCKEDTGDTLGLVYDEAYKPQMINNVFYRYCLGSLDTLAIIKRYHARMFPEMKADSIQIVWCKKL